MSSEERHRLEIILEDMNGKLDLLLGSYASLKKKIDDHCVKTRQHKQELMSLIRTVHNSS